MLTIPAAWFLMGSESGQENERPVHRVWVSEFELAATQVTNLEFSRYLQATGAQAPPHWKDPQFGHPQQPVVAVSWFEAAAYCEWLTRCSGRSYRLPTEAEWERAARAGREGALYPWGDEPPQGRPGYAERWLRGPEPVGRQAPNGFGLYDICDNVHEWCSDWFDPQYYAVSPERDPQGPAEGARRASPVRRLRLPPHSGGLTAHESQNGPPFRRSVPGITAFPQSEGVKGLVERESV